MWEIAKKWKIWYNAVYYSLHRTAQTGSNQNRKKTGRPWCTTEQEDKYIRVSSLRNRCLTSPQLAASLIVPTKHQSQQWTDYSGMLAFQEVYPLSSVCVLFPILIFYFYWPIWAMAFYLQLCLECRRPGVVSSLLTLRMMFWGYYLMKLPAEDLWGVCFSN